MVKVLAVDDFLRKYRDEDLYLIMEDKRLKLFRQIDAKSIGAWHNRYTFLYATPKLNQISSCDLEEVVTSVESGRGCCDPGTYRELCRLAKHKVNEGFEALLGSQENKESRK
jgi:hypothetical protein